MKTYMLPSAAGLLAAASLLVQSTGALAQTTCPAPSSTPSATLPYITSGESLSNYTLTFSDEFNTGSGLDASKWNNAIWYETPKGPVNYDVNNNRNGKLRIWPQSQGGKFYNRTIDTDRKFSQTYGYFEICAKLPRGVGPWPAFWLFNHEGDARPEIDIMEAYPGSQNKGYWSNSNNEPIGYGATVWHDSNRNAGSQYFGPFPPLSKSFNVYAVKWDSTGSTFYFNGVPRGYKIAAAMPSQMYILLSLWFGGESGKPSNGNTPTGTGNAYEIDYVRVWRLNAP